MTLIEKIKLRGAVGAVAAGDDLRYSKPFVLVSGKERDLLVTAIERSHDVARFAFLEPQHVPELYLAAVNKMREALKPLVDDE